MYIVAQLAVHMLTTFKSNSALGTWSWIPIPNLK